MTNQSSEPQFADLEARSRDYAWRNSRAEKVPEHTRGSREKEKKKEKGNTGRLLSGDEQYRRRISPAAKPPSRYRRRAGSAFSISILRGPAPRSLLHYLSRILLSDHRPDLLLSSYPLVSEISPPSTARVAIRPADRHPHTDLSLDLFNHARKYLAYS